VSDRREFLKNGIMATGVVAAGAAGSLAVLPRAAGARPPGRTALEVTHEGDLVLRGKEHAGLPASDPNVRRGVPNRRWVMVIDLAACNGCAKCTDACNAMHHTPGDRAWIRVFKMKNSENEASY